MKNKKQMSHGFLKGTLGDNGIFSELFISENSIPSQNINQV